MSDITTNLETDMGRYIIFNQSQDAWLSGRVWYAHKSYADKFAEMDDAEQVASIMEARFPQDKIYVLLSDEELDRQQTRAECANPVGLHAR